MKKFISTILAITLLLTAFSMVSAADTIKVTKTYELLKEEKVVQFTLEGYDSAFTVELIMPNGKKIDSKNSTKLIREGKNVWVNALKISNASKGKYTFNIQAPKVAYYNLIIEFPLFSDISNHWAQKDINEFVQKGIVAGYGNGLFKPNENVNGDALVKMAVLALTEEQPNGKRMWKKTFRWKVTNEELSSKMSFQEYSFIGSSNEPWSKPYFSAASDLGITNNWANDDFIKSFKRKDVALLVANIMNMVKINNSKPAVFNDTSNLSDEYMKAIELVNNFSIFGGYPDGSFKPDNQVTRAEAVIVLSRLNEFLK
ncbi:S-layer homology domain-containing protein [Paenibacillus sp. 2TAB26]|uniref:S-layer homology domain-containing protein n=1 Tax=Paenibacillus sp. 2TAB26 TaxID=3233005 RepID=UPI003F9E09B0